MWPGLRGLWRAWRVHARQERLRRFWQARQVGLDPTVIWRVPDSAEISIGPGTTIGAYTLIDLLPDPLAPDASSGGLRIGSRVAINEFNNLRAAGSWIEIGDGCLIAQFVTLTGSNHGLGRDRWVRDQPWSRERLGVRLGADVWVGAGATLLPGVSIGEGGVVAAGAVVTSDVAPYEIVGGIPARVLGRRE